MKWKYFRDAKRKVSKWTLGNNWVTKWDTQHYCIVGVNGQRFHSWMIEDAATARVRVEEYLSDL